MELSKFCHKCQPIALVFDEKLVDPNAGKILSMEISYSLCFLRQFGKSDISYDFIGKVTLGL